MPSIVPMSFFTPDESVNPDEYTFEINDAAARSTISNILGDFAAVESTAVASQNYGIGDYLVLNGTFYRVTTAISSGSTIAEGTNVARSTVGHQIKRLMIAGEWTPTLYDLNTYKRDLKTGYYIRMGKVVHAWLIAQDPNLSGISTMMQIRNIPMTNCLGGSLYFATLNGSGAYHTIQASEGSLYIRPNLLSNSFSDPTKPGIVSIYIFGIDTNYY